ncbi:MAG: zinc-ribbon domain-containing protein [Caldicoprobacterales bacterium]
MGKYCTKCGSELHTSARFCAKCGAAVLNASANPVPGAQPKPMLQRQTNSKEQPQFRTAAQPQYYTSPVTTPERRNAAKPTRKRGSNTLCIVLSVLLVIQTVVVALYGWPGLLAGGKDMAAETEKTTVSMDNPSVTLAEVRIDANTLNLMDGEKELTVSRKTQSVDETTGLMTMEYDIALEDMHLLYAPLTLTVPYDMAAAAGGDVVIEHYSSDYGMWIPQITVDNGDGTVTASLTSLSPVKLVYLGRDYPEGVFYISERDSNYAKMMVNHQYWNIIKNMPRDDAQAIVKDFVENGNTRNSMPWAENLLTPDGINLTNNMYSIFDALIGTISSFTELTSMQISFAADKVSEGVSVVGLGIALTQLGIDLYYSNGNDRTAAVNLYKNVFASSGTLFTYMTGYGSLPFSAAFLGVAVLAFGLDYGVQMAEEYKDTVNKAIFDQYYKDYANFNEQYWYKLFVETYIQAWQNGAASQEGVEAAYKTVLDAIEESSEEFWADVFREGSDALTFAVAEADKTNYFTPKEEQKAEYIEAYRRYMNMRFREKVVPWIEQYLLIQQQDALYASLNKLCEPFNEYYTVEIQEIAPLDSCAPCIYQEHTIRFGNESGFALTDIPCTWTLHAPQDDDEWAVLSEFTFLSYLLAGAPDRIMLYPKGSDAKHPEDAVLSKTFTLADKFTVIPLGSTSITPKWFEGSWKHLASDTIIHFGVPDDNTLDYTVSLDGKDLTTRTTISFDFQTASITTKYVSGTVSLKAATYYGYVEDGKDYIRIGPFRGEGKPGTYSEGEAIYVRVN